MNESNVIVSKSMAFAVRIVNLYKYLKSEKSEYILSKQVLRSGTSIGANVKEAVRAQTKADFNTKMHIAMKEASETEYWLELLEKTDYLTKTQAESILNDCVEIIKILVSITKTLKNEK
ncbi:MAG: four helix bundle protein [Selenomonadaceae bacterium]|nr:four helix bundle protein [Selenomonadaceae bacterium]